MTNANFFKESAFKNSINFVLLNLYALADVSLCHGKAGVALLLFELYRCTNEEKYEEYAYELLKEVLVYEIESKTFASGCAGIGYLLQYLIKNDFLDADYEELYFDRHRKVLEEIEENAENLLYNKYDYADFLFFIQTLSVGIDSNEQEKFKNIIVLNILSHLLCFQTGDLNVVKASDFFHYSSSILSICNVTRIEKKYTARFINKIMHILKMLSDIDIVCCNPIFALRLLICGIKSNNSDVVETAMKLIRLLMTSLHPGNLNFKEKTDIVFCIYQVYTLDNRIDYRYFAYRVLATIWSDDPLVCEDNLYRNFCGKMLPKIDYGEGLSRLLLLKLFWQNIEEGKFIDNKVELFK